MGKLSRVLVPKIKKKERKMVPCKSTAKEVSFEWSHYRIKSKDSQVNTTLHVFIILLTLGVNG